MNNDGGHVEPSNLTVSAQQAENRSTVSPSDPPTEGTTVLPSSADSSEPSSSTSTADLPPAAETTTGSGVQPRNGGAAGLTETSTTETSVSAGRETGTETTAPTREWLDHRPLGGWSKGDTDIPLMSSRPPWLGTVTSPLPANQAAAQGDTSNQDPAQDTTANQRPTQDEVTKTDPVFESASDLDTGSQSLISTRTDFHPGSKPASGFQPPMNQSTSPNSDAAASSARKLISKGSIDPSSDDQRTDSAEFLLKANEYDIEPEVKDHADTGRAVLLDVVPLNATAGPPAAASYRTVHRGPGPGAGDRIRGAEGSEGGLGAVL